MTAVGERAPDRWTRGCAPQGPCLLGLLLIACATAACGDNDRPAWCGRRPGPTLDCPDGRCVLAVAIDYVRLEPRGYRPFALGADSALTLAEAEERARSYLVDTLGAPAPDSLDCEQEDDFFHCSLADSATQDRYLVVIFGPTGQVLFAEPEIWADEQRRGFDFPLPAGFTPAEDLGCATPAPAPERIRIVTTGIPLGNVTPSTGAAAIAAARQRDLVTRFVGAEPYRAFAIAYGPAIGGFDAEAADWYVWLYRHEPK